MEVGLFHGRTAILLGLLRNNAENFIGIDAFGSAVNIQHEDRQVDLDHYGDGNLIKTAFMQNWASFVVASLPDASDPVLIEKDSRLISTCEIQSYTSGVRFFSLDGGHSEESTFHDLELAEAVVTDGGILIVDDYFLEDCPAVSVGTIRYFLERKSKFVPFLIFCGRVFFTTKGFEEYYRQAIFSGDIFRWVKFGEFMGRPMVSLIDREKRDIVTMAADVAEWRRCEKNYSTKNAWSASDA
jgi:hypothetical protein